MSNYHYIPDYKKKIKKSQCKPSTFNVKEAEKKEKNKKSNNYNMKLRYFASVVCSCIKILSIKGSGTSCNLVC